MFIAYNRKMVRCTRYLNYLKFENYILMNKILSVWLEKYLLMVLEIIIHKKQSGFKPCVDTGSWIISTR